jgi:hypothetical protein
VALWNDWQVEQKMRAFLTVSRAFAWQCDPTHRARIAASVGMEAHHDRSGLFGIATNDLCGDPSIRRRQTTASKQLQ